MVAGDIRILSIIMYIFSYCSFEECFLCHGQLLYDNQRQQVFRKLGCGYMTFWYGNVYPIMLEVYDLAYYFDFIGYDS